ncbi:MAG TPA: hypothetical protein VL120_10665 [Solirubrobacteraceae bacterium]|nr:hypothetical protein [Solirubrobacteraceae bacterium]
MGDAIRPSATRAGVSFEVERLEHAGDELVVSGHWSGLRGVRFMRPTLVVGDREVLATLEHKPWAPRTDRAWIAAFPWTGGTPDAGDLELAVAPSVTVQLGPPLDDQAPEPEPALVLLPLPDDHDDDDDEAADAPPPLTTDRMRVRLLEQEVADLTQERDELRSRFDEAQAALDAADAARVELELSLRRERRAADSAGETRDEVARARAAAERDRDNALAQRDEAVKDQEAAVRTRARMELAAAEAAEGQAAAEAALDRARAERDEAHAQRDEVLLAYRALQRHIQSERAGVDRAEHPAAEDVDLETPLGVRTMPAARTIMAELQRPKPSSKFVISQFDVWVVRVLGSVAAGCFIMLLIAIIRVFI